MLKDNTGENTICHALTLCLKSASQWRQQMIKENNKLKQQLKGSKEKTKTLTEKLELTLLKPPKSLDIKQIPKLITSPEDGDGDICKSSDDISDETVELDFHESTEPSPLKEEEIPEFEMKTISKTELSKEVQVGQRSNRFTPSITLLA